jgi:alkaline phosphatase D
MKIDRRTALGLIGLSAASPAAAGAAAGKVSFRHGVASGDPLQDRVVLWTRITPAAAGGQIAFRWKLNPVDRRAGGAKSGTGVTGPERDYTAKVDVTGLDAGRAYTFTFEADGVTSPMGRTMTLPAGPTKDVVFAVASCSLYPQGYFNAYRAMADLPRLDLVLHMGDYIYEYGGPGTYGMDSAVAKDRPHDPPREILSLADYRQRHAQYKADPDLQAAHARAAWIVAWDDHETTNDSYSTGAQNHQPATEGDWTALKAYYEWMPIREPRPGQSLAEAAARSFRVGDLAQIIMLETRLTARDKQLVYDNDMPMVDGKPDFAAFRTKLYDPARRMMGPAQEAWLADELSGSVKAGHAWQVIGTGVFMARVKIPDPSRDFPPEVMANLDANGQTRMRRWGALAGQPYGLDMWDGYPVDRERVYDMIKQAGARPIVVSGDSHAFWANELSDASGKRVACEFAGTSITSPGGGDAFKFDIGAVFAKVSEEVVYNDQSSKGFVLVTLSRDAARGDLVAVSTIVDKTFTTRTAKSFVAVPDGAGISALKEI